MFSINGNNFFFSYINIFFHLWKHNYTSETTTSKKYQRFLPIFSFLGYPFVPHLHQGANHWNLWTPCKKYSTYSLHSQVVPLPPPPIQNDFIFLWWTIFRFMLLLNLYIPWLFHSKARNSMTLWYSTLCMQRDPRVWIRILSSILFYVIFYTYFHDFSMTFDIFFRFPWLLLAWKLIIQISWLFNVFHATTWTLHIMGIFFFKRKNILPVQLPS